MYADFIYPEYEVVRNYQRCIACRACERQCANEVHRFDEKLNCMVSDESKCVNCHRCVSLCPTRALKIVKTSNADTPIARDLVPLITCDVWEHAYYIDYRNARKSFVETFLDKLVNWDFAASQLK